MFDWIVRALVGGGDRNGIDADMGEPVVVPAPAAVMMEDTKLSTSTSTGTTGSCSIQPPPPIRKTNVGDFSFAKVTAPAHVKDKAATAAAPMAKKTKEAADIIKKKSAVPPSKAAKRPAEVEDNNDVTSPTRTIASSSNGVPPNSHSSSIASLVSPSSKKARKGDDASSSTSKKPRTARSDFETLFARLVAFRKAHGNCRVPQSFAQDEELAKWVVKLRRVHNKQQESNAEIKDDSTATNSSSRNNTNILTVLQIQKLDGLGFEWKLRAGRPKGATIEAGAKKPIGRFIKPMEGIVPKESS